jgi:hypothetical protein
MAKWWGETKAACLISQEEMSMEKLSRIHLFLWLVTASQQSAVEDNDYEQGEWCN